MKGKGFCGVAKGNDGGGEVGVRAERLLWGGEGE